LTEVFQRINWIDLLVVILLIKSGYVGFTKGFGWELFRLIGYICTLLATIYFYEPISRLISDYISVVSPFSNLLSFTAIYLIILLLFKLAAALLERLIKKETFSSIDRVGGLVLGFFRGSIGLSLLMISLIFTPLPYFEKSIKERSYTGQTAIKIVPFIYEKSAMVFPILKSGQRNEALSRLTDMDGELLIFHPAKEANTKKNKSGLRGD